MPFSIGLDIGGTKIAGAAFDSSGKILAQHKVPTPQDYGDFLQACKNLIDEFDKVSGQQSPIGIGIAGAIDQEQGTIFAPNIPCLKDKALRDDWEKTFGRPVRMANDAKCAALAEAIDGAGKGYHTVFGMIMGTGVGGGLVIDGKPCHGMQGIAGEIGHLPLPFRDATDGPLEPCECGQKGCIDKSASGPALARLYKHITGRDIADAHHVVSSLADGDADAGRVLDQFYTTVTKAMITIIHSFDPQIIVINGGLNKLPGLYEEVPKRWGRYALREDLRTKLAPGKHGGISGLRGAAMLGRQ